MALEMRLINIAFCYPVLSRIALMPPLHPSVRFDQILLDRCLPPAHVSVIKRFSHVEIADMSFTRSDPVGAVLPASNFILVSIMTRARDDFPLTRGTVAEHMFRWSDGSGAIAAAMAQSLLLVSGMKSKQDGLGTMK